MRRKLAWAYLAVVCGAWFWWFVRVNGWIGVVGLIIIFIFVASLIAAIYAVSHD